MYPDYSYYTAITFIPTYMIPLYLVFHALLKSNIIEFYLFRFLWEKGIFQTTELHRFSLFLFWTSQYNLRNTVKLANYLVERQRYRREISKSFEIMANLQNILNHAKLIFALYLVLIYFASF